MLYYIKDRDDLEKLNELASLQSQVKALRLQNELGKQKLKNYLNPRLKQLKMCPKM